MAVAFSFSIGLVSRPEAVAKGAANAPAVR
jgi:hypothetical protein